MTTKASTAAGTKEFVKSYEPTPYERRTKPPAPRIKVSEKNGVTQLAFDHTNPQLLGPSSWKLSAPTTSTS